MANDVRIGAVDDFFTMYTVEKRLKRISEMGFEGVQLWLTCVELGFDLAGGSGAWFSREYKPSTHSFPRNELRRILRNLGLTVSQLGPHYVLGRQSSWLETSTGSFSSESEKKARITDIKRLIDCAADLEVNRVGLMSGGNPANEEHWHPLVEMMKELTDHAEAAGVTLTAENLGNWQMLINDETSLIRLVEEVDSKALKINFDPKNLNWVRPDADIPAAVHRLGKLIVHTHAGDSVYGEGAKAPIGTGTVPYPAYIAALHQVGFDGWLQIEAMKTEEQFVESKRYLEGVMDSLR